METIGNGHVDVVPGGGMGMALEMRQVQDETAGAEEAFGAAEEIVEEMSAAVTELTGQCTDCAVLRRQLAAEVDLRHSAEQRTQEAVEASMQFLSTRDAAIVERDAAIAERDARALDMTLRAQRVDVEALRHKVAEMKKNLTTVDARADERFAERLAAKEREVAARIAAGTADADARVAAVVANEATAAAQIAGVREGEAARVEAERAALELIWAWDRRDRGAPKQAVEVIARLRQLLSTGLAQPQ
jgi:hypothetical protein